MGELLDRVGPTRLRKLTGVGAQTMRDWRRGGLPSMSALVRFAKGLGVTTAQLLGQEPLPRGFIDQLAGQATPSDDRSELRELMQRRRVLDEERARIDARIEQLIEGDQAEVGLRRVV